MMEIDCKEENSNQIRERRKAGKLEQEEGVEQAIYLLPLKAFVSHTSFTFTSPRISVFHNCRDEAS